MYKVYLLKSNVRPKTYVGIANDLARRLNEHNSGRHHYTKRHMSWRVTYFEDGLTREEVRKREKYFKSAAGRKKLKIILEKNQHWGIV